MCVQTKRNGEARQAEACSLFSDDGDEGTQGIPWYGTTATEIENMFNLEDYGHGV